MRKVAFGLLVLGTMGCNGGPATPTAPTATLAPPPTAVVSSCAPPATQRVYTVPVPGHSTPVHVWLESITPPAGATVRVGDSYTVSYRHVAPAGFTARVQVFVGERPEGRFLLSSFSSGGCSGGLVRSEVPSGGEALQLRMRVWARPGSETEVGPAWTLSGPPDLEAIEPVDWTVVP